MPKAIRVYEYGGPEVMKFEDVPLAEPGPGQNAFDTMPTSGHIAITLDVLADSDTWSGTEPRSVRPKLDTVLFAFEHCYVATQGNSLRIRYAEMRLWDLREQEARVAEIFPAGAVEFRI